MKYLVVMDLIGATPASPNEALQFLKQRALPQVEAMIRLEKEKKILAGGPGVGKKGGAFIVDAASNEELNEILLSLPLWSLSDIDVTPLGNFEHQLELTKKSVKQLEAIVK